MTKREIISQKITALFVYGRPPLVFAGMICAIAVIWKQSPVVYTIGVVLLFISMSFDLVDGWFAARFELHPKLAPLADRLMDKLVYSIIFPLVAVGVMWRVHFSSPNPTKGEILHAILVLLLAVTVLIRDNFAHFMRGFAIRKDQEPEYKEFTRLWPHPSARCFTPMRFMCLKVRRQKSISGFPGWGICRYEVYFSLKSYF
jgi:CDP-diacylglycerol--serine O-phosphatidyltransferase